MLRGLIGGEDERISGTKNRATSVKPSYYARRTASSASSNNKKMQFDEPPWQSYASLTRFIWLSEKRYHS